MDEEPKFRPTPAPEGWQDRVAEGEPIYFESPEEAEAREAAWREFAQPGQRMPLLSDDGVTTVEIASVGEDGTIEIRGVKPE